MVKRKALEIILLVQPLEFLEALPPVILSDDLLLHDSVVVNDENAGPVVTFVCEVYPATLSPTRYPANGGEAGRREDKVDFLGVKVPEKFLPQEGGSIKERLVDGALVLIGRKRIVERGRLQYKVILYRRLLRHLVEIGPGKPGACVALRCRHALVRTASQEAVLHSLSRDVRGLVAVEVFQVGITSRRIRPRAGQEHDAPVLGRYRVVAPVRLYLHAELLEPPQSSRHNRLADKPEGRSDQHRGTAILDIANGDAPGDSLRLARSSTATREYKLIFAENELLLERRNCHPTLQGLPLPLSESERERQPRRLSCLRSGARLLPGRCGTRQTRPSSLPA